MFDSRNIRAEMARNDIKVGQLAKHLNISNNTMTFKLQGKREFTLKEFESMADLFKCSLDYLAGRPEKSSA